MTRIPVETIDGKIWRADTIAMKIARALQSGPIVVDLLTEGPCCYSAGIDELLMNICDIFNHDINDIQILTSNQIQSSRFNEKRTAFVELDFCQRFAHSIQDFPAVSTNKFGMFVSRSNWKRLGLASYLWSKYKPISNLSFHFDISNDYHRTNFGLENLLVEEFPDYDILDFVKNLPLTFDQTTYPIQYHTGALSLQTQYQDIFCDIVCETYFSGKTFFVTEKTWRPIIYRRPFIVQGPQWYLKNLRRLGFRTFSDWWSEGYDEDINGGTLDSIRNLIDFIGSQSQNTINR
jgi:hypothetical protein